MTRIQQRLNGHPRDRTAVLIAGQHCAPEEALQAAKTAITCNDLQQASVWIGELERRFRGIKEDIKRGLRCRWEIAACQFRNALGYYEQLDDKERPVHKALRRDILRGILATETGLPSDERQQHTEEVQLLDIELTNARAVDLADAVE